MLHLYVDSADRDQAGPLLSTGLFRGLTTNPLLLRRSGLVERDLPELYGWATGLGAQEVFLQTWGATYDHLVATGRRLRAIGPAVVVKAPATRQGCAAAATLAAEGVPVLLTAVYAAPQALLAAAAGATYLAPYVGRMADAGRPAIEEVTAMQRLLDATGGPTRVLAASLRTTADVVTLAGAGVRHFALAPAVAERLFGDPLTEAATAEFEAAAAG
ncbi:transaldolase family protein [Nonomuraea jiangxiensis]|uniref:Transaldolase n=1 Tax=Nonomuraea jiangxiensis TaxID=633440 RepID=A0A1G8QK64_9ACTN|nr:transaldolase family protein [Nonomuraea jiangxiensis]SDJ05142.1 transaldolase [Nonomuraea jiangxiensis]